MNSYDAALELAAMLEAERERHYSAGAAGAVDAIAGRRRVEALELALALLDYPPSYRRRATVLDAHEWEAAFAALEAERARGDRAPS